MCFIVLFFFKQKTAYEMRISDWSSDVCSSDLRLLAFSRRQPLDPHPINIARLIADMEDLVRRTVGPSILVEIVHPADLWPVLADGNQLENALLNLVINARDAMPSGGQPTIRTACAHFGGKPAAERAPDPGADRTDVVMGKGVSVCVDRVRRGTS